MGVRFRLSNRMSLNKKNLTKMADELALDKKLKFDRNELEKLLVKFSTLCNQKQLIDRNQFRDLLHDTFHMTEKIQMKASRSWSRSHSRKWILITTVVSRWPISLNRSRTRNYCLRPLARACLTMI